MSKFTSIESLTLAIPGAGRRTLLAALPKDLSLPEHFRLCVLDATRMDAPAQIALLDELAAQPDLEVFFVLNKADRLSALPRIVSGAIALLRERGFAEPRLWPVCAAAARLFALSPGDASLRPKEIDAQAAFFKRFAPGRNSLAAFAFSREIPLLDGRKIQAEQLQLALCNTGVPSLEAALRGAGGNSAIDDPQPASPSLFLEEKEPPQGTDVVQSAQSGPSEGKEEKPEPAQEDPFENAIDHLLDRLDAGEGQPATPQVDLAPLLAQLDQADCRALLELAQKTQNESGSAAYREQALEAIHAAYQKRQTEELEALTADLDAMELPALRATAKQIGTGAYTVQVRSAYLQRVNARMDALLREQLSALCVGVETADAQTLDKIRKSLDEIDCAEVLKTDYYQQIEERQDQLDLENLERITAGAETMTEEELRAVAVTLEANNWSPKFVARYRHKIALCLEAAMFQDLEHMLDELNDMERRELLDLRARIEEKALASRFTAAPLAQIDEKLYRMDMLRLMALHNEFDLLDFDGLDGLRVQVGHGDYCERARMEYLGRLREREEALVLENTDARAQLVRQLIGQYKLRMADFVFAGRGEDYQTRLAAYWGGSGMEQPRDIPVFLFDSASDYAFTGQRFYYRVGKELAFLPIGDIERLQIMKQHMSLFLQVVRKDNSYLLTGAKISRSGAERTLEFLNECLRRWNAPEILGAHSTAPIRTRRFDLAEFTAPVEPRLPDPELARMLFYRRYEAERIREGVLCRNTEGDQRRLVRLLTSFGLPQTTPIIWYHTSGLLGVVRDGVAVGPRAIYWKENKQPVQEIPLKEIYSIQQKGKQVTVTTLGGQRAYPQIPAVMVPLVEDYARSIQLGSYLASREARHEHKA